MVACITAANGYYIPMDGPWDSPEDDAAYKKACDIFDEMRLLFDYVVLIKSCHRTTHGYWIENVKKEISFPDRVLKGGDTIHIKNNNHGKIKQKDTKRKKTIRKEI